LFAIGAAQQLETGLRRIGQRRIKTVFFVKLFQGIRETALMRFGNPKFCIFFLAVKIVALSVAATPRTFPGIQL